MKTAGDEINFCPACGRDDMHKQFLLNKLEHAEFSADSYKDHYNMKVNETKELRKTLVKLEEKYNELWEEMIELRKNKDKDEV